MSSLPSNVDVVIVGAGPTGLALAIGLAEAGTNFVILDALPEAQDTSRAAVIHAGTLDSLRHLDVTQRLIAQGIQVPNFRIRDRSKVLMRADFSVLSSPTPYALMIPQNETEAILTARLDEFGHSVQRPVKVSGIDNRETNATVKIDGSHQITTRYVVGADGEKSTVRSQADISFPGKTYGSFMLADVHMEWPIAKDEVTLFFSKAGTLVVAPMSRNRYRVVAQLPGAPSEPTIADVQRVIDVRGPNKGARVLEVLWGSRFQVHHKLASSFLSKSVTLMGDAAHVHSPAGGQGMNLGLRDAVALAKALPAARRTGSDQPLEEFARTRRIAAQEVLQMTDLLTAVATTKSRSLRVVRNTLIGSASFFPLVRKKLAQTLAGTH